MNWRLGKHREAAKNVEFLIVKYFEIAFKIISKNVYNVATNVFFCILGVYRVAVQQSGREFSDAASKDKQIFRGFSNATLREEIMEY
uniref:Uncharacterized protein n=1 Tax=Romanomermis culicivorax TaxID=13658 RepID=A0A915HZ96_ROMCU